MPEYAWMETCELVGRVAPPSPPGGPIPDGYWVYLPPGPYRASGDRDAQQSPPRPAAVLRVPEGLPLNKVTDPIPAGCWMGRFEVTCPMYIEYLNDREWHKACKPWDHVVRMANDEIEQNAYFPRNAASGTFSLPSGWKEWPVFGISWNDGTDYCEWLTDRLRTEVRLR